MTSSLRETEDRGRTLDQVLNPGRYRPFSDIAGAAEFELAWRERRDWVLANMAHAAYCEPAEVREVLDPLD